MESMTILALSRREDANARCRRRGINSGILPWVIGLFYFRGQCPMRVNGTLTLHSILLPYGHGLRLRMGEFTVTRESPRTPLVVDR